MGTGRSWQLAACFLVGVLIVTVLQPQLGWFARGQDVKVPKPSIGVAVVDVALIYKKDATFTAQMEKWRREVEEYQEVIVAGAAEAAKLTKQLAEAASGSDEAKQLEIKIAVAKAEQDAKVSQKLKGFTAAEGRVYIDLYDRITKVSKEVCSERELRLLLRFSSEPLPQAEDRGGVMQMVNRPVVFQDDLDITDEVLKRLKAAAAK